VILGCETFQERIAPKNRDKQVQTAYEIFSIEHKFWQSKFWFSRFNETCAWGHQNRSPP